MLHVLELSKQARRNFFYPGKVLTIIFLNNTITTSTAHHDTILIKKIHKISTETLSINQQTINQPIVSDVEHQQSFSSV